MKSIYGAAWYWLRTHVKAHVVLALVVFAATFAGSLYYWDNIRANVRQDLEVAYQRQVRIATNSVTARLQLYGNFMRGGAGLFTVNDTVRQEDWQEYFRPYGIQKHYPDIEGIGFSRYIPQSEVAEFTNQMVQTRPGYHIFPAGDRPSYTPVTFNARFTGNNGRSIGYDGSADPIRKAAMDRAAASGGPSMSGQLELVSANRKNRPAFIVYLPVYKKGMLTLTPEQRRAALYGFVYIAVDIDTMFDSVLTNQNQNSHFGLQVYDIDQGGPGSPAYESDNFAVLISEPNMITTSSTFDLYGRHWRAVYAGSPGLITESERGLAGQALWRGFLSSLLFAMFVWYLIKARERKLTSLRQQEVQTAKDDLLSLASHQLRTPATVVKQYVGMLLQGYGGDLTKQQINMLEHAYESNERQLEIINQLLYVARLDAGRITLQPERVDLVALIREVVQDQDEAIKDRNQAIAIKPPRRRIMLDADPRYLRMVFENLLSNSVKYTPEGGNISFAIRKTKHTAVITVRDNGVGINAKDLQVIFDKFSRVENELSTDVNGSGVGLYLTQQIVRLHQGEISVQSRIDGGSVFTVTLPLKNGKHRPEETPDEN